jgi:hypothetical protein
LSTEATDEVRLSSDPEQYDGITDSKQNTQDTDTVTAEDASLLNANTLSQALSPTEWLDDLTHQLRILQGPPTA